MRSWQVIGEQEGVQALAHHNTVFSRLLKLGPRHEFETLANWHHEGRTLRKMTRWSQFVSMALAQLSGRSSLRDAVSNLSARTAKPDHLGSALVSRSSLAGDQRETTRITVRSLVHQAAFPLPGAPAPSPWLPVQEHALQ